MVGQLKAGEIFFDVSMRAAGDAIGKVTGALRATADMVAAVAGQSQKMMMAAVSGATQLSDIMTKVGAGKNLSAEMQGVLDAVKGMAGSKFDQLVASSKALNDAWIGLKSSVVAVQVALADALGPTLIPMFEEATSALLGLGEILIKNAEAARQFVSSGLTTAVEALSRALGGLDFNPLMEGLQGIVSALQAGNLQGLITIVEQTFRLAGLTAAQAFSDAFRTELGQNLQKFSVAFGPFGGILGQMAGLLSAKNLSASDEEKEQALQRRKNMMDALTKSINLNAKALMNQAEAKKEERKQTEREGKPKPFWDIPPKERPTGVGGLVFSLPAIEYKDLPERDPLRARGQGAFGGLASERSLVGQLQGIEQKQLQELKKQRELLEEMVDLGEVDGGVAFR